MLDRRKFPRALLAEALEATLRLTEDVLVESYASNEITVVSGVPARSDQCLAIAPVGAAPPAPFDVRVTESTPAVVDGVLRHRLRLRVLDHQRFDQPRMRGALVRDVPVRVLDVSAGGCLMETGGPVNHGTAGELHVTINGEEHADTLRVCRCSLVRGAGSMFRLGAEFGPMTRAPAVWAMVAQELNGNHVVRDRAIGR